MIDIGKSEKGRAHFHRYRKLNEYRLVFLPGSAGIGKRMEFSAQDANEAIELAYDNAKGRIVQVWENGELIQILKPPQTFWNG